MRVRYVSAAIQAASDANDHLIWQQRGAVLAREHRLQQLEIADWLLLGIEQYGAISAYDYAESVFPQYTRATFQVWVCVAKRFNTELRIESDWLTFGHYQAAQGAERDPWAANPDSKLQVAQELVWLRQADDKRLSVSALRYAITNAYELRKEAFYKENPDARPKPAESEPEPRPEPKKVEKDCYGAELKELKTPLLPKRARSALDQLAIARRVRTEQLLNRIIQDFLDAHSDEVGDAESAAKKRAAKHEAQVDAADAGRVAAHKEHWRLVRERDAACAEQKRAEDQRQAAIEQAREEQLEKQRQEQREKAEREQRRIETILADALVSENQQLWTLRLRMLCLAQNQQRSQHEQTTITHFLAGSIAQRP